MKKIRLEKVQNYLREHYPKDPFTYTEVDGLGSLDFSYRGIAYHIWEYCEDGYGVETNIRDGGRSEDITGDYEEEIIRILDAWE